jgi:hypothetical protein
MLSFGNAVATKPVRRLVFAHLLIEIGNIPRSEGKEIEYGSNVINT